MEKMVNYPLITLLLINLNAGIALASPPKMISKALEGYSDLNQGDSTGAQRRFSEALDLASDYGWPTFTNSKVDKALLKSQDQHECDWQGSDEQKISGLMQVYNSVEHYFAGFELAPELNWRALVSRYIPQMIEAKTPEEYYQLLQKLIANLRDNHSVIIRPKTIREKLDRPPVSIEYIENKFIITKVTETTELQDHNIHPGLEIKMIDGIPALEYFRQRKMPYLQISKIERERYYYLSNLLEGDKDHSVKVTVANPEGEEREASLMRNSKLYKSNAPLVEMKELDSSVVYFNFRRFEPRDSVMTMVEKEFDKLNPAAVRGMIFDVRENFGGYAGVGYDIISRLIDEPVKAGVGKIRVRGAVKAMNINPLLEFAGKIYSSFKEWHLAVQTIKPRSGNRFSCPVVVLISRYTGSAAEQFVAALKENRRAILVGETTRGGTGDGVLSILPGYGLLRVSVAMGAYADGKIWQGVGISPDIENPRRVKEVYQGCDSGLEKGLEVLREQIGESK